jgi:hypothetical protein
VCEIDTDQDEMHASAAHRSTTETSFEPPANSMYLALGVPPLRLSELARETEQERYENQDKRLSLRRQDR